MSDQLVSALGIAAAIGTTGAFLPQVIKTLKTRETGDFSWGYLAMFTSGVALWIVYGVLKKDVAVIGANVITLVLVSIIIWVKLRS